jgi:hypothetical protein
VELARVQPAVAVAPVAVEVTADQVGLVRRIKGTTEVMVVRMLAVAVVVLVLMAATAVRQT